MNGTGELYQMSSRFEILRPLEEDTASKLLLVRDTKRGEELRLRRFKTQKPEELEGLQELFRQLSEVPDPHLESVIEYGADKEGFYTIVAGPLPGETLPQVLERGPLTQREFETLATQLLDALSTLHEVAIVHGSLRPEYVRIAGNSAADWQVTVHGFGQGFAPRDSSLEEQIRAYRCTAPEQWQDGTTRRRTDVYALGCILYEALTARSPFDARALKELRLKHLEHDLAPLSKQAAHVPTWMSSWVMHLMAADPEQRPRKAGAARELFHQRVAPGMPSRPETAPPPPPTTPRTNLIQHQVSAPVTLPNPHLGARNEMALGIRLEEPTPALMPAQRKTTAPQRQKAPAAPSPLEAVLKMKPVVISVAAVLLLLTGALLRNCSGQAEPVQNGAAQKPR